VLCSLNVFHLILLLDLTSCMYPFPFLFVILCLLSDLMELTQFHGGRLLNTYAGDFSEEADLEKEISVPRLPKSFALFRTQFSAPEPSPQRTSVAIKGEK